MRRFGAQYCECFGTKKQRRNFYKDEYHKHLWTWGAFEDKDGRIRLLLSAPPKSLKGTTLRGVFKEAANILPREHRGGRPHSVQSNEVPRLRAEVERLAIEHGSFSSALRHLAEMEGMDTRTLKTALGDLSSNKSAMEAGKVRRKKIDSRVSELEEQETLGRHFRRNAMGSFDQV